MSEQELQSHPLVAERKRELSPFSVQSHLLAGVMSGASADAIDVATIRLKDDGRPEIKCIKDSVLIVIAE